jgi:hypothetical protein
VESICDIFLLVFLDLFIDQIHIGIIYHIIDHIDKRLEKATKRLLTKNNKIYWSEIPAKNKQYKQYNHR